MLSRVRPEKASPLRAARPDSQEGVWDTHPTSVRDSNFQRNLPAHVVASVPAHSQTLASVPAHSRTSAQCFVFFPFLTLLLPVQARNGLDSDGPELPRHMLDPSVTPGKCREGRSVLSRGRRKVRTHLQKGDDTLMCTYAGCLPGMSFLSPRTGMLPDLVPGDRLVWHLVCSKGSSCHTRVQASPGSGLPDPQLPKAERMARLGVQRAARPEEGEALRRPASPPGTPVMVGPIAHGLQAGGGSGARGSDTLTEAQSSVPKAGSAPWSCWKPRAPVSSGKEQMG